MKLRKVLALVICAALLIGAVPLSAARSVRVFTSSASQKVYLSPAANVLAGDINNDGKVNNKDLTRLFQFLSDWEVEINEATLDTNGDGKVNNKDLTRLFQFLSDWDVKIYPEPILCDHTGATQIRDAIAPTCSAEGFTGNVYCLDCGSLIEYGSSIAKIPHSGGEATCHTRAVCEMCGEEYGEFNPYYHDGGTEIRDAYPAKCMTSGYEGTTYCLGCGAALAYGSYPPPTGIHLNTEVRDAYPATCSHGGYTGTTYCSDCGLLLSFGDYTEPNGEHVPGPWIASGETHWRSCTECGVMLDDVPHSGGTATCCRQAICDECGAAYGPLDTSNHTGNIEVRGDYPATCGNWGYTGDTYCLDCGNCIAWGTVAEPTGVHLHTRVEGAMEPTCMNYGYTGDTYCDDCGMCIEWGTQIEPTGHLNTELRGDYPATCGNWGYTGDTYCLDCGMLVEWGTMIEPTGVHLHTYVLGDYPAACEIGGYTGDTYCSDCNAFISSGEYIPPTGHQNTELRGAYPATCMTDGYTGDEYCADCGMLIMSGEPIQPTGHINTEIRGAIPVTCTSEGYTGDEYCLDCGECIMPGTYIAPVGHMCNDATYYQKSVCIYCGEEYYKDILAYDQLDEVQKGVYDAMDTAVNGFNRDWFDVPFVEGTDTDRIASDIKIAFHAFSIDKPEYFWLPKDYVHSISTNRRTGAVTRVRCAFCYSPLDMDYLVSEDAKYQMQWELETKLEEILAQARTYNTDFEKEVFVHDYLCRNITYDHFAANNPDYADPLSWTVYGALINGKCVCEGYSRSMQLICRQLGIPCSLVTGWCMGGPHMWNIIRIDDGIYYLDVTFDDSVEQDPNTNYKIDCLHDYFNLTTEEICEDHVFDEMFVPGADYSNTSADINMFETHGDYTEAYYYTAIGAHIYANDATAAAQYVADVASNFDATGSIKYVVIEYDASLTAREALALLKTALAGRAQLDTAFSNFPTKGLFLVGVLP